LQFNPLEAIKLYWVFAKADRDNSGIIDSFEWLMYLDVERTEFNEKIFTIVDFDESGEMDFREFVMCCWNYASAR
jgi:Ca2+-binding EF-hand superfamily protein